MKTQSKSFQYFVEFYISTEQGDMTLITNDLFSGRRRSSISSSVKPSTLFKQSTIVNLQLLNPLSLQVLIKSLTIIRVSFFLFNMAFVIR